MKKRELPDVSTKNTKEQILAAYSQALEQINQKEISMTDVQKFAEKAQLSEKVGKITNDSIVSELSVLKSKVIGQLDTLSSGLLLEFKKLTDIQSEIAFEKEHLEELYGIRESTQTLAALIQAREESKLKLDEELKAKKSEIEANLVNQKMAWKESQDEFDRSQREIKVNAERQRAREEEEYIYNRDLARRKDNDAYLQTRELDEQKIKIKLHDIEVRENQLAVQEQQVNELKNAVENHPKFLQSAVKEAEEKLRVELTKNNEFEKKLLQKDYENQLLLKSQSIESYLHKIKEQEVLIKELTARSDQATKQVQDIACKALESSSQRYIYQASEAA